MFPDIEDVLCDLLVSFVASADHIDTYTPSDLSSYLPFIRVNRYGGGDNGVTDFPAVDVEVYAATRDAAFDLSRQIHEFLIAGPHGVIDRAATSVGPSERPRAGAIRRVAASYTFSARRA